MFSNINVKRIYTDQIFSFKVNLFWSIKDFLSNIKKYISTKTNIPQEQLEILDSIENEDSKNILLESECLFINTYSIIPSFYFRVKSTYINTNNLICPCCFTNKKIVVLNCGDWICSPCYNQRAVLFKPCTVCNEINLI